MTTDRERILIWDLPLRLFHWGLMICLIGSWITAEAGFDYTQWHFYFGYATLTLLTFRVLWGLVGSTYSRFRSWPLRPSAVWHSIRSIFSSTRHTSAGHNPLGSLAIVLMLAAIATQAVTGLFISDDIFWSGPYNGAVTSDTAGALANIHHLNFDLLVSLIALHLTALLWYRWRKGERLVGAMLTGYKSRDDLPAVAEPASGNPVGLGLAMLLLASALIGAALYLAPPPAPVSYF